MNNIMWVQYTKKILQHRVQVFSIDLCHRVEFIHHDANKYKQNWEK